jgi:hypothetical protein
MALIVACQAEVNLNETAAMQTEKVSSIAVSAAALRVFSRDELALMQQPLRLSLMHLISQREKQDGPPPARGGIAERSRTFQRGSRQRRRQQRAEDARMPVSSSVLGSRRALLTSMIWARGPERFSPVDLSGRLKKIPLASDLGFVSKGCPRQGNGPSA